MARIKMQVALKLSDKWQITDASQLHWRKKLKRAAEDCGNVAHKCRQISLEEDKSEQVIRQSSFPRRIAHAAKAFISSFVSRDNDHCSAVTITTVRRFERLADGAAEFVRFVQLGGTPRHHLFFDPLIGHMFAGKTITYQLLHPGGQYHYFNIRPMSFEERGLEAMLSFIYEDCKVPKNSFGLGVMMRLSESTDIIGTTVKCLQLVTPHFKSMVGVVIKEITQLPTQDFSCVAHVEHWNNVHRILTRWFRPDPLCCQGYEHDVMPSCCHEGSDSSRASGTKLRLSSIFPKPVLEVFLQLNISLSEYSNMSASPATSGHDDTISMENFLGVWLYGFFCDGGCMGLCCEMLNLVVLGQILWFRFRCWFSVMKIGRGNPSLIKKTTTSILVY
uniref:Uncharacterized protein n=1 Tax=Aegilops tauschii TaxID=37682 RepID=M8CBU0_AEGTA